MPLCGIPSLALLATLSGFTLRLKPRKTGKLQSGSKLGKNGVVAE
jgi:hypothetical protein